VAAISAFTRVFDALWRPSKDAANCFSFSRCAAPRHSGRASVASESRNHRRCRKIPDGPGYGFRVRAPARPGMTPYESVLAAPTRPSHAHHQPHDPEKWSCGFRTKIMRKQRRGGAPKGASSHGRPSFPSLSLRKVSGGGSAAILARIARLPALHGGACPDERTSGLSPGRASRELKETRRRYPRRHSRLSGAPRTPIVMPEGTMPGPPGSEAQPSPAGTALAPWSGVSRGHAPHEQDSQNVTKMGTFVKSSHGLWEDLAVWELSFGGAVSQLRLGPIRFACDRAP